MTNNLVTVDDWAMNAMNDGHVNRLVVPTHEHILLEHVTQSCGYGVDCAWGSGPIQCQAWIQNAQLWPNRPWPGRSGSSIYLQVHRQPAHRPPPNHVGPAHGCLLQTRTVVTIGNNPLATMLFGSRSKSPRFDTHPVVCLTFQAGPVTTKVSLRQP